ncbi:Neural cell adhesion molecule 2 [Thelohanellus kitauei]|uniref:Neural cell adhesion molecule 2 n=1 Tax=Thelohanellus kitauei TaxID=669202 RepID=A0A0C2J7D4_THEKT|nr:Neural cell adhesion molecule 2 [Thelohanellus kitauei]
MSFARLLVQLSFLFCGYDANTPAGGICHRMDRELTYVSNEMGPALLLRHQRRVHWLGFPGHQNPDKHKYSLSFDKEVGAQVLSLSNIQESDAGTYFCRVSGKNQEIRDYPIVLNIRAQLTNENPTHYLEVSKTERITLNIIGIPFPTIHFYRENNEQALVETYYSRQNVRNGRFEITSEGDILIHTLNHSDTGRYVVRLVQGSNYVSEDQVIEIRVGARPFVAYVPRIAYNFTLDQDEIIPTRFSGSQLNIYWKFTSDTLGERPERIIGDTDDHYFVSVDGALTVRRVVTTDAGKYIGICRNPWGEVQVQTVVKKIIRAAKILVLNNQVGKVGQNVTINVEVTGDPPPYISWWRNGVKINGFRVNVEDSALRLSFLKRNDAGIYTCVADNGATRLGRSIHATKNVSLYIEGFPVMDTELSTKMIVVTENRRVAEMTCVVNGLPISQIRFVLNGITYFPTSTTSGQKNHDQVFASLKLTINNPAEAGTLTCYATNAYGTSSIKINIEFLEIPKPPRNLHILQINPNSVKVGWDVANQQLEKSTVFLAMIWSGNYKFKRSLSVSEFYVVFKHLRKNTTYYFSVRASNLAGWSTPSNTIVFRTPNLGRPTPPLVLNRDIFLPIKQYQALLDHSDEQRRK